MSETLHHRRKRLLYQAMHRGIKEADIVIGGFATAYIDTLEGDELDEFEALIAFPDKELFGWIVGRAPPPDAVIGPVFKRLQAFDAVKALHDMTAL